MGDYRRMGNMGQRLGDTTTTTSLHNQLSELWRSPRGTVVRIEALALVAIVFSFFLASFGSCRRWSNRWIVQKGFLAAQVLSLSLGTYSIGLMQSSPVKSEMYPIWAVSLLTLFGCVDPVTSYIGLDYKGPLLKTIFQLSLYCGYAVVMSLSIVSAGFVGSSAIWVLTALTFIKGFHRSLALVLPLGITRLYMGNLDTTETRAFVGGAEDLPLYLDSSLEGVEDSTTMGDIHKYIGELQLPEVTANGLTIEDVCLSYSLSHFLQKRFLELSSSKEMEKKIKVFERLVRDDGRVDMDYKRSLKVVEVELAFLYEVYFSSKEFIHFYQAKTCSFWALASFIGICFVGVAAAIPWRKSSSHHSITSGPFSTVVVVDTTTPDLIITLFIAVCLALLQLIQLMGCWTSNWARVAFACEYTRNRKKQMVLSKKKKQQMSEHQEGQICWEQISPNSKKNEISGWMKLKALLVTRINWFDRCLWQDKLGQYSLVDAATSRSECLTECFDCLLLICALPFVKTGNDYVLVVLDELLGNDTNMVATVGLHDDVKTSIADFLLKIKSRRIGKEWSSVFVANGIDESYLPYSNAPLAFFKYAPLDYVRLLSDDDPSTRMSDAYTFTHRVMMWHIATWHCSKQSEEEARSAGGVSDDNRENKNRRVAIALSKYCAYLVVSAPELLPGSSKETKKALHNAKSFTTEGIRMESMRQQIDTVLEEMGIEEQDDATVLKKPDLKDTFASGVYWGEWLLNTQIRGPCSADHWELLALLWVQTLLYAAPYGDVQRHMLHLSQGGEFITHLWALLYHLGIDRWEHHAKDDDDAAAGGTKHGQEGTTVKQRKAADREATTSSPAGRRDDGTTTTTATLCRARSLPAGRPGLI